METIEPADVEKMRASGRKLFLVDVRNPDEYQEIRAKDAVLYPLPEFDADAVGEAFKAGDFDEEKIYVICRSGARSANAVGQLESVGVKAVNVTGGTLAWNAAGLPVENG
ncbi:MAG: rhodanese-like domain-containing protein [bacterium]|nr:rhodanese-like domain-containing protein [bacterium]